MKLDLRQGYDGLLKLGSGWRYVKPPRYSIHKASQDMRRVKEILFPRKEQIFRHRPGELRQWDNSVTKRHINLLGGQGSGKGHTARWIARWCWEKYQEDQRRLEEAQIDDTPLTPVDGEWGLWVAQGLNYVEGRRFNMTEDTWFHAVKDPEKINELLTHGLDPEATIQVVHAEDLTSTLDKLTKSQRHEAGNTWFRIRHKLRDATGHQEGLIVGILGLHRFHGVPPPFTTDIDLVVFKSMSTNPYDREIIKRYVGSDGIQFLEMLEQERVNDPAFKGYGIWYHRGEVGVWYNPVYPGSDPFQPLRIEQEPGDTPMTQNPRTLAQAEKKQPVTVGDYVVETLGSTEDPGFREEVLSHLSEFTKRTNPALDERDKLIMRLTFMGETQNTIAAQAGVSPSRVGQIQREIKQQALGYAGEAAYHKRRPELEYIGGNAHEPDFLDHMNRTVISFKTYHEPALRDTTTWICERVGKEEMRYSQQHGYTLEMIIYELAQGRFFRYRYIPRNRRGAEAQPHEDPQPLATETRIQRLLEQHAIPAKLAEEKQEP